MKAVLIHIFRYLAGVAMLGFSLGAMAQDAPLLMAVNEGITYRINPGATADRFKEVADDLGKLLKRTVRIEAVTDYSQLAQGLAAQRFDLAYVHPAHVSIRAMAQSGYRLVAVTKGFTDYRASFLVRADSPLKSLADVKGLTVGMPDADSITSVMVRATLREVLAGREGPPPTYVRLQEAVPFMVENKFVATGATASRSLVRSWQDKGGRVLATTRPVPIKHVIASSRISDVQRAALTAYFTGLDQMPEGKRRLEGMNITGFTEYSESAMLGLGTWLGL
jgi:phosphonate transport system substrate-binding protein